MIQSLRETLLLDAQTVNTFDTFRKKRNATGYERIGLVSGADADAMRALAVRRRDDAFAWLKMSHPAPLKSP